MLSSFGIKRGQGELPEHLNMHLASSNSMNATLQSDYVYMFRYFFTPEEYSTYSNDNVQRRKENCTYGKSYS